jgi:hypothetical protein
MDILLKKTDIASTGLRLMKWNNHIGLVRVIGQPKTGWKLIQLAGNEGVEALSPYIPKDGSIPNDALFSDVLNLKFEV